MQRIALTASTMILVASACDAPTRPSEEPIAALMSVHGVSQRAPVLVDTVLYGGSGDQRGTGLAISGSDVYVSGISGVGGRRGNSNGLLLRYELPLSTSVWDASPQGRFPFSSVALASGAAHVAGWAWPSTCGASDGVGSPEGKGAIGNYTTGGTMLACRSDNFFRYRGYEGYSAVLVAEGPSGTAVYTAGGGEETGWGGGRTIIAMYDESGTLQWKRKFATDLGGNQIAGTFTRISSYASALAWLDGYLYVAGYDRNANYVGGTGPQAMLLKVDALDQVPDTDPDADGAQVLTPVWESVVPPVSQFAGMAATHDAVYVVGHREGDYLVHKYDQEGNLLWSTATGGVGGDVLHDVVPIGSRLFAVGWTTSEGAGGADVAALEIDPSDGSVLWNSVFGGAQDDRAHAVATDGTDLFVVGESRSFAEGTNAVGQADVLLLRYAVPPPIITITIDIKPGSDPNSINRRSRGNVPVALLSSETFDALTADRASVVFAEAPALDRAGGVEDVDGDGQLDVVLHFATQALDLPDGTTEACLTGETTDGQQFRGCDAVRLVR